MTPARPAPMSSSTSSTPTAAIMPSSRFVVARSPDMAGSLERRRLMRARIPGGSLRAFANRIVEKAPPLVRDARRLLYGRPEAVELARQVVERRLDLTAQRPAVFGEKQIPREATHDSSQNRGCHSPVIHATLPDDVCH